MSRSTFSREVIGAGVSHTHEPHARNAVTHGIASMRLVCNRAEEPVIQVTTSAAPGTLRHISFKGGRAVLAS